jgi:hypothetical protein
MAREGIPVMADDALLLRMAAGARLEAVPAYPGLRLWPEMIDTFVPTTSTLPVSELSRKRRVRGALPFDGRPLPLAALYVLGPASDGVTIAPLGLRETTMALVEHGFRLEQRDGPTLAREMHRACDAAQRVRAFALSYPRDVRDAPRVAAAIAAHARSLETACCS